MLTPPPSDSSHAGPSVERRPIKRARAVRVCTRGFSSDHDDHTHGPLDHALYTHRWPRLARLHDEQGSSAQLEAELNQLRATSSESSFPTPRRTSESSAPSTSTTHPSATPHTSYTPITSFQQLAKQLPPLETCHTYLDHFAKFDVKWMGPGSYPAPPR
jgi:hypothetical protein